MLKDNTRLLKIGKSRYVLLPSTIYRDSMFPFKDGEDIEVEIKDSSVIVRKVTIKKERESG